MLWEGTRCRSNVEPSTTTPSEGTSIMTTTTATGSSTSTALTRKQKVGLVLAALYSLSNIPSFLAGGAEPGEEGPPMAILVVGSVLGVVGLVAAVLAWRGQRVALRVCAGAVIVLTLTGLPAFFVDVPMAIKAFVAFSVVLTVLIVVLMFSGDRRSHSITD
jgi:hypothetical protein